MIWMLTAGPALSADPALKERGRYVAIAADCISCHSAPGGKPFAGGAALKSPFGTLYGSNITPDARTGIGEFSEADFDRALRQGLRKDGSYLYPAMPYGSFTKITDADAHALWTYFRSLAPIENEVPKNAMAFPFNIRSGLAAWRALYFTPGPSTGIAGKSAEWNRGAYLVDALAHCNECHTPRNAAQALQPRHALTGARIEGWYAPDISDGPTSQTRGWSGEQWVKFLKTGLMPNNAKAVGPMQLVVHDSLQYLTDSDLKAMVTFLKDQPGDPTPRSATPVKFARLNQGKRAYEDNCGSCHGGDGRGRDQTIPALAGNGTVTAREPFNVIMAILQGFPAQGSWGAMNSFASALRDDQIADVANYVRTAWNNSALPNATPWSVSALRKQLGAPADQMHALLCPNLKEAIIKPALALDPSLLKRAASDETEMRQLVAKYRGEVPSASPADVVEALSTAYCRAVAQDRIPEAVMGARLADFAQQAAMALPPEHRREAP